MSAGPARPVVAGGRNGWRAQCDVCGWSKPEKNAGSIVLRSVAASYADEHNARVHAVVEIGQQR